MGRQSAAEAASPSDITVALQAWSAGSPDGLEDLMRLVVDELRRTAHSYFQKEDPDHVLQPTALVNEVCLKLMGWKNVSWQNRAQFFGFAGKLMRRLLIDQARARKAERRGSGLKLASLTGALNQAAEATAPPEEILDLNAALIRLAEFDPRASQIIELRFFAGLDLKEVAKALNLSYATVKRDWSAARQWLAKELGGEVPLSVD